MNSIFPRAMYYFLYKYHISNSNWTEWSTIQGVIGGVIGRRVISNRPSAYHDVDLKLRAGLPLNCTTGSSITN